MPTINVMSEVKEALMAYNAKILEVIKSFETTIVQMRSQAQGLKTSNDYLCHYELILQCLNRLKTIFIENADRSDSKEGLTIFSRMCSFDTPAEAAGGNGEEVLAAPEGALPLARAAVYKKCASGQS